MKIRTAKETDFSEWLRLRKRLYPECTADELMREIEAIFYQKSVVGELDYSAWVAEKEAGVLGGFCEISLRESAPECETHPVGYVESLYVEPDCRRNGLASEMLRDAERWIRTKSCSEFYVDTEERYEAALRCYEQFGFVIVVPNKDEIILRKVLR